MVQAFPEGSGSLPEVLYRLLDPAANVELPPAGSVQLRDSDNRELDKLVAALGRNKTTWRRALALHEWLLQVRHWLRRGGRAGRGASLRPAHTHSVLWLAHPLPCNRLSLACSCTCLTIRLPARLPLPAADWLPPR